MKPVKLISFVDMVDAVGYGGVVWQVSGDVRDKVWNSFSSLLLEV